MKKVHELVFVLPQTLLLVVLLVIMFFETKLNLSISSTLFLFSLISGSIVLQILNIYKVEKQ